MQGYLAVGLLSLVLLWQLRERTVAFDAWALALATAAAAAVAAVERLLVGVAVAAQAAALYALPLEAAHGWHAARALSVLAPLAALLAWGAVALHPGMWWLTQPGRAAEPWPTRSRLALLAPAAVAPLALGAYETVAPGQPVRGVTLVACTMLAGLLAGRLVGLAAGHERMSDREAALQAAAAALAVTRDRDQVRRATARAAIELAGGAREAYVDVDLSQRPKLELRDAAVVGSGEIAEALRGQIRRSGSLARTGAARTIVAPVVVRGGLQGVVRVTGTRPLAWHLEQSLGLLAGQAALALEALAVADDLAERRSEARRSSSTTWSSTPATRGSWKAS